LPVGIQSGGSSDEVADAGETPALRATVDTESVYRITYAELQARRLRYGPLCYFIILQSCTALGGDDLYDSPHLLRVPPP
jgi:hypothetical protein